MSWGGLFFFLSVRPSVCPSVRLSVRLSVCLSVIATKMSARFPTPEICVCVCPATEGSTEFILRFLCVVVCDRREHRIYFSFSAFVCCGVCDRREHRIVLRAQRATFSRAQRTFGMSGESVALSAHPRMPEGQYFCTFWVLVETIEMSLRSTLVSPKV